MRLTLSASLALLSGIAFAGMSTSSFTGLSSMGNGFTSQATSISSNGTVAGWGSSSPGVQAWRTSASTLNPLGDLAGGTFGSYAMAISDDATVVVGQGQGSSGTLAFRWTTGGMVSLGDLAGGSTFSSASATNADGSVVVGQSGATSGMTAFRWTSSAGLVGLGDLAGGAWNSVATATTANGTTVFGYSTSTRGVEAFRWTAETGMQALGALDLTQMKCYPAGCNASGSVIVGNSGSTLGTQAFRWENGTFEALGDLPGGVFQSSAMAVSDDGTVIVGNGRTAAGSEAFIWTREFGLEGLKAALQSGGADLGTWILRDANAITGDGTTIAGFGSNTNGINEAFRATLTQRRLRLLPVIFGDQATPRDRTYRVRLVTPGTTTVLQEFNGSARTLQGTLARLMPRVAVDAIVESAGFLRKRITGITAATDDLLLQPTLLAGDVDGDNEVSILDYLAVSGAFESVKGNARFLPAADFDFDGEISILDYIALSDNFEAVGDN